MAFDDEHPYLHADLNPLPPPRHLKWRERWQWKARSNLVPILWGENCCTAEWYAAVADIFGHCMVYPQEATVSPQADLLIITGHISEKAVPSLLALDQAMPHPHFVMAVGACTQLGDQHLSLAAEQDRGQILQEAYTVAWSGEQDKSAKRKDKNKGKHKNKDSDPDRGEERPAQGAAKLAAALGPENTLLLARPLAQIIPVDVVVAGCPPTPQALAQGVRLLESMIKAGYRGQRPPV